MVNVCVRGSFWPTAPMRDGLIELIYIYQSPEQIFIDSLQQHKLQNFCLESESGWLVWLDYVRLIQPCIHHASRTPHGVLWHCLGIRLLQERLLLDIFSPFSHPPPLLSCQGLVSHLELAQALKDILIYSNMKFDLIAVLEHIGTTVCVSALGFHRAHSEQIPGHA